MLDCSCLWRPPRCTRGNSGRALRLVSFGVVSNSRSKSREGLRADEARLVALMERYQRGEAAAFEELYDLISGELKGYLLYLCGDPHLAEDCAQECFLQIHRARHTYCPSRPFRPWAYAIARHVYFMDRRSQMRRRHHEYRFPAANWCLPSDIERLACRDDLSKALARLPVEARESLVLHHAFGLSFAEIGALTGSRAGTAKTRSHRALAQMREELSKSHG